MRYYTKKNTLVSYHSNSLTEFSQWHFYQTFLEKFVGSLQKITIVHSKICQMSSLRELQCNLVKFTGKFLSAYEQCFIVCVVFKYKIVKNHHFDSYIYCAFPKYQPFTVLKVFIHFFLTLVRYSRQQQWTLMKQHFAYGHHHLQST